MHLPTRLLAGAAAATVTLGVLSLTGTAQAVLATSLSVPAGVETALVLPNCATGNTVSSVSSSPALPATVNVITSGVKSKLSGDWPAPPPSKYTVTVHCSGGSTKAATVTVTATPAESGTAVGVGSDTYQSVSEQFSADYNATKPATKLYNFDATNPNTGAIGDPITTKAKCSSIARPDGGSAGLTAMDANAKTSDGSFFCIDFTRTARGRQPTDPPFGPGGIAYVTLAQDALSYATQTTTDAPSNLTTSQLASIYNCTVTNWNQVGGQNAAILPFLPQTGSAIRSQFLTDIGVSSPGACVNSTVQQNEGTDPQLNSPQVIVPYSVAKFIAQKFHSAKCLSANCAPDANGVVCKPTVGQNQFGCNLHGTLKINSINGTAPTVGTGKNTTINPSYTATFLNTIYDVVRYDATTPDHIPAYLEPLYAAASAATPGWACANATAQKDLKTYGYLLSPLCGLAS